MAVTSSCSMVLSNTVRASQNWPVFSNLLGGAMLGVTAASATAITIDEVTYRERRQKLKEQESGRVLQIDRIKELKEYLQGKDTAIEKFDGELFSRLIEKVIVRSLVEVTFVFKTGVEVREVLE